MSEGPEADGRCYSCQFWQFIPRLEDVGECRRLSPVRVDKAEMGTWPKTTAGQWCGQYKHRKAWGVQA